MYRHEIRALQVSQVNRTVLTFEPEKFNSYTVVENDWRTIAFDTLIVENKGRLDL